MQVKDLVVELQKLPQNLEVLLSSDAEGNDFNSFSGDFTIGCKVASESPWERGFITEEDWGEEHEGVYPGNDCVVMWP